MILILYRAPIAYGQVLAMICAGHLDCTAGHEDSRQHICMINSEGVICLQIVRPKPDQPDCLLRPYEVVTRVIYRNETAALLHFMYS